ncbi:MAG TPA: plastocyanin/azurin family copper-binding protein [Candidatus Dormibacteraeota bacterium]
MRRLLMAALAAAAVAAGACGGNSSGGGGGSTASTPPPSNSGASGNTLTFTETEYKIAMSSSSVKAGDYTFKVDNQGKFPHDLHIATPDGSEIGKTDVLQAGGSGSITVTLKAGTYSLWCAVDAHKSLGMSGTLTVT